MQVELPFDIKQRSDYTFKYNTRLGRHGWLRLTPAYSVKLVRELMPRNSEKPPRILDPFSGTATTGLVAAEMGFDTLLFDINPFLIWLGNAKCRSYSPEEINRLELDFVACLQAVEIKDSWLPPIFNIERWWHKDTLKTLGSIRSQLVTHFGEPQGDSIYDLIWVAFSRLIIETSAAAFNHVSMSFKEHSTAYQTEQIIELFKIIFKHILNFTQKKLHGKAQILKADARDLQGQTDLKFDHVITSPPYPNRISYIRELRPYMYWLKFLTEASDAGKIDWQAIGGTWGTATSNLKKWQAINDNLPQNLYDVCEQIRNSGDKNSDLMNRYVHKYFDDMFEHFKNLKPLLEPNAKLNYIVGNSSFYGNFVHTEKIFDEILSQLEYTDIQANIIRKRNSKKGLFEFNISARN